MAEHSRQEWALLLTLDMPTRVGQAWLMREVQGRHTGEWFILPLSRSAKYLVPGAPRGMVNYDIR